jgi:crotonobetainyl-CoA:carnitine CoA-transferase CaiB-like acyl-CoA transferase
MGDRNGALALALGVAAALVKRSRSGAGSVVDVSLLGTAMWTLSSDLLAALGGDEPKAAAGREPPPNPLVGVYRTKDARHIQLVFLQPDRYWGEFCRIVGRPGLAEEERFSTLAARRDHAAACMEVLDEVFAERTLEEWKLLLDDLDAPWSPVQSVPELLDDPQVHANGYIGDVTGGDVSYRLPTVPVQFDGHGPTLRRAPEHGEDTESVLLELGYDWGEISALQESGAIP